MRISHINPSYLGLPPNARNHHVNLHGEDPHAHACPGNISPTGMNRMLGVVNGGILHDPIDLFTRAK
jgi:hypothetical protein